MYLFQRHNTHQLSNTGDIGVTEAQQGEQSVCLSDERGGHDPVSVMGPRLHGYTLVSNWSANEKQKMYGAAMKHKWK